MNPLVPALWLLSFGLAGGLVYEAVAPVTAIEAPANARERQHDVRRAVPSFVPPPIAAYAVINQRPLFTATREAVVEPFDVPGAAAPDIVLVGVMIGPGRAIALLRRQGAPQAIAVAEGQSFEGWQLAHVDAERAILSANGTDVEVRLRPSGPGSGAITLVPPTAPISPPAAAMPPASSTNGPPVYRGPPGTNQRHRSG
jgi:hypothetical protein